MVNERHGLSRNKGGFVFRAEEVIFPLRFRKESFRQIRFIFQQLLKPGGVHPAAQVFQGVSKAVHILLGQINAVGLAAVFRHVPDDIHHLKGMPQGNGVRIGGFSRPHDAGGGEAHAAGYAVGVVQQFIAAAGLLLADVRTAAFNQVQHGSGVQLQILDEGYDVLLQFRQFQAFSAVDDFYPAVQCVVAFAGSHARFVHDIVHRAAKSVKFRHMAAFFFRKINESKGQVGLGLAGDGLGLSHVLTEKTCLRKG